MSLKHFRVNRRMVYLGGVRLWPLPVRVLGRWVEVKPVTVNQMYTILEVAPNLLAAVGESGAEKALAALKRAGAGVASTLLGLVGVGPLPWRIAALITSEQIEALVTAVEEVNDIPYIVGYLTKPRADGDEDKAMPWDDWVDLTVRECPCYTHADVLALPFQKLIAIWDSSRHRANIADGRPFDSDPLPEETMPPIEDITGGGLGRL